MLERLPKQESLGPLEVAIMELLWIAGEASVREVTDRLERRLAYTTVMTTLDRLFKKGILDRRKSERAFLYQPKLSRTSWETRRAGAALAGILARGPSRELLASYLVDAVGEHDPKLLEELEAKIRLRREQLSKAERGDI